jgi:hypothetical protein
MEEDFVNANKRVYAVMLDSPPKLQVFPNAKESNVKRHPEIELLLTFRVNAPPNFGLTPAKNKKSCCSVYSPFRCPPSAS